MTCADMRLALALAAVLPAAAHAAVIVQVNGSTNDVYLGAGNCKTLQLAVTWDLGIGRPVGGDKVELIGARNLSTCSSTGPNDITLPDRIFRVDSPPTRQTDSQTLAADQLVLGDGGVASPCDDPTVTGRSSANPWVTELCVQYQSPPPLLGGNVSVDVGHVNVNFALKPPTPPANVSAGVGDRHLRISWSPGDPAEKIARYEVHVVPKGSVPDGGPVDSVTGQTSDVTHTDDGQPLQNGSLYGVTVLARDLYDNLSGPSAEAIGAPQKVLDFYDQYRSEGGGATGGHGCATGAGAWIAGLGLAVALLARRRSKARGGAGLLVLVGLLAPSAEAARYDPPPRKLLFAVKIDRYDPNVDSEPGLTGQPYHEIFGTRVPLRVQLEADWEVAHPFGSVLIGATVGYWQNYGKGLLVDRVTRSDDTVLLDIIPFGLIATYRFDWLADRLPRFPFIPYAQVGLQNALWASFNGTGGVSKPDQGGRGSGWTYGYTTALGIALNLNAIDPELAREAYVDTGIQRSSLFVEYGWTRLDNFGRAGALHLSDRAWRFGFALEF
jgi:hypothetical protein